MVRLNFICSMVMFFTFIQSVFTEQDWANSVLEKMTLDEKIGQIIIPMTFSNRYDAKVKNSNEDHVADIDFLIDQYHIGGIILEGSWEPIRQAHLIRHFQSQSRLPLLIAQNNEWGLSQRLGNTVRYPMNMTIGAIEDDELVYRYGLEVARQDKLLGIDINFAPVVDVNVNPENPVINQRSFGDDPHNVARKGLAFMRGLQDGGVIACAKHFPGHGDTTSDSHENLPVVNHSKERLEKVELFPFQAMIDGGVKAVMVAHIAVPTLDETGVAATVSPDIVSHLLKEDMGFDGVVFTDAMDMQGILENHSAETAVVRAFKAGNDVILSPPDVPKAFKALKEAVLRGEITEREVDNSVLKILQLKEFIYQKGEKLETLSPDRLYEELNSEEAYYLKKTLFKEAVTLVKNNEGLLPLAYDSQQSIALVQVGGEVKEPFRCALQDDINIKEFYLSPMSSRDERHNLMKQLSEYKVVIIALHDLCKVVNKGFALNVRQNRTSAENFGVTEGTVEFLKELKQEDHLSAIVVFGSPYSIEFLDDSDAIVVAYEDDSDAQEAAAHVVSGKNTPKGKLSVLRGYGN